MSWTRSGVRVPPITAPEELFDKLFLDDTQSTKTKKKRETKLHASILDAVLEQATDLSRRVNAEDRQKLDEYFSSVRDVEKKIKTRQHPNKGACHAAIAAAVMDCLQPSCNGEGEFISG